MEPLWTGLLVIALGGAVGGLARFWVSGLVGRRLGERFPWGTLTVNVTGCAAVGALAAVLIAGEAHSVLWLALATGILGSYTTVSSFALQTLVLLRGGARWRAGANVAASVILCLLAAAGGYLAVGAAFGIGG